MKARRKQFLNNSHEEFGSVSWYVNTSEEQGYPSYVVDAELSIRDCYKVVTLDLSCEKINHIDKRLQKLDNLIGSLQEMRDSFVQAAEEVKTKETNKRKFYY